MSRKPPFYQNWDNTHCVQCTLRGVLEHFQPEKQWTWEELDHFSGKEPDKWTWQYRALINMHLLGYDVVEITSEDIHSYLNLGLYETMVKDIGKEAADISIEHTNIEAVKNDLIQYDELVQSGAIKHESNVPTIEKMQALLQEGYLIGCALNARILYSREGYAGHMVLVYDIDDQHIYMHDSNPSGGPDQKVEIDKFVKACTNPTPAQWEVSAFRLKQKLAP